MIKKNKFIIYIVKDILLIMLIYFIKFNKENNFHINLLNKNINLQYIYYQIHKIK
jgi:hypothetical protein